MMNTRVSLGVTRSDCGKLRSRFLGLLLAGTASIPIPALAQTTPPVTTTEVREEGPESEIVVIGTYIKGAGVSDAVPVSTITSEDLSDQGITTVADAVRVQTFNTGSQNYANAQDQGGTVGTANINLRGLGLNSTLVLLNGRRQTQHSVYNLEGRTFVDINSLVPFIMVERIDALKDGAAALYGTDAVAGVVNFTTYRKFDGLRLRADAQTTGTGGQRDVTVSAMAGASNDATSAIFALSYFNRSALLSGDRSFTRGRGISTLGQPGSFAPVLVLPNGVVDVGAPRPDPLCGAPGVGGAIQGPFCTIDFSDTSSIIPRETRFQAYTLVTHEISQEIKARLEAGISRNNAKIETNSSFPALNFPIVPANNPGNTFTYTQPFGPPGSGRFIGDRAATRFFGRALGLNYPPQIVGVESTTWRIVGEIDAELSDNWNLRVFGTYSANHTANQRTDLLRDRFEAALAGRGGPNNNLFFNPFGNSVLAAPGSARFNDPSVISDFTAQLRPIIDTSLYTADAILSGRLFDLPGGPVGVAAGVNYRSSTLRQRTTEAAQRDNLLFFIGERDFDVSQSVTAAFAELRLPVLTGLEIQAAARYENYGNNVNSFDPKIAMSWRPIEQLLLRASYGTSFSAPTLFQSGGFITSNTQLTDPLNPTDRSFRAVRTESNPNLRPEGATATTFGIEVKPVTGLKLSADFWRYDFADLIIRRNPQAVLSANPNDPRIIRSTAIGRPITRVETDWFNAASVKTDGIDFSGRYTANLGSGSLVLGVDGSYIHKFDIDNGLSAAIIRGVGNRNFTNSLSATPRWRVNGQVGWSNDRHNATLVGRYISSYTDDDPRAVDRNIGSWTVFDLNYALKLDGVAKGARLGAGVMNLFDRDPPTVDSSFLGYDTETHDPRGRIFQASIGFDF